MTFRKSNTGFTLIELMAVVVVVAVLTLIAYPAYQSFVVKANRAEAKSYLMNLAQKQQLYFNDSRNYAADMDELNLEIPDRVEKNYTVSFDLSTTSPVPEFVITAEPIEGTNQEPDGDLSIDHTGEKLHKGEPW